jgi:hypothetical protein
LTRKAKRQLRNLEEGNALLKQKQTEMEAKKKELERKLCSVEIETLALQKDIKMKDKRIEELQIVINTKIDMDTDSLDGDNSDSGDEVFLSQTTLMDESRCSFKRSKRLPRTSQGSKKSVSRSSLVSLKETLSGRLQTVFEEPENAIADKKQTKSL